jgi:methionyl-tRNA formyltransferase
MVLSLRARSILTRLSSGPCRSPYLRRHLSTDDERPAEPFRVLFCGSDVFSVAALEALLGAEDVWQSIAVLTPRERAIGRGGKDTYTRESVCYHADLRFIARSALLY